MSQQKRNPDIDFGFHATIPRAVRTHYKTLTPMQKWLYVCLKDLCGEHGTCYRTVKVLSAETNISTGMISESIPLLHQAGLIHGEKKKRSSGGKEVWHITIVDIWPANGKLHPTKRSLSEQTTENVHSVNENVHSVNDQGKERSASEQERSLSETEEGSSEAVSSFEEGSSEEEGTYGADAPTPAHIKEQVDEEIEKVKTTSGRLRAMKGAAFNQGDVSDSQMDIGNDAEEETKPRVPAVRLQAVAAGQAPSPLDAASRQTTVSHTPGTPPRPLAAGTADVSSRHGDADSRQASRSLLLDPEPAQADFPPAGSAASGTTTAQAMGRRSTVPRRPKGKPAVLELTLAGMDVKSWYEQVRGKLRMTERNVNDCNALGECDGIELESLRVYFEHVEALKWVKQYGVVIDLATAAGTTGNDKLQFLSFESNWPLVKKKLQLEQRKNSDDEVADDDYSPAGILKLHEQRERKQAQEKRGV